MTAQEILKFWFQEATPQQRFAKDIQFDELIRARFGACYEQAVTGELFSWRKTAEGRLAEIILLDQFSRNLFRDHPRCFAADPQALTLAQEMVLLGLDQQFSTEMRSFIYMPYMHSESLLIHEEAVRLFSLPGLEDSLKYEYMHLNIIKRFGRYPHRNKILGRESTAAEIEFLKGPNSGF